jgi:CheY-like chemotaxis protein
MARRDNALADNNKTQIGSRVYQTDFAGMPAHNLTAPDGELLQCRAQPPPGALGNIMVNGKKTVAVVDDDPEMRAAMASLLTAAGYCPETFDSAETFLTCASTSKAICLVVDIELGDVSGIELAHQLVADGFSYPIIFMTGLDDELIQSQAASAGAVAFLRKPFPAKLLFEAIQKAAG